MNRTEFHYRIEMVVRSTDSREYTVSVHGRMREDGRWEANLEFAPVGSYGRLVTTPVQTTQSSVRQILYWAGGLSRTHLEDSLQTALHPTPYHPTLPRPAATPATDEERRQHLHTVERDILAMFRDARTTRLPTQAIFGGRAHSNADFVRAFEDLEKQWRYLIRRTVNGVDWIDLTVDGARAAGVPAVAAGEEQAELPRPPR